MIVQNAASIASLLLATEAVVENGVGCTRPGGRSEGRKRPGRNPGVLLSRSPGRAAGRYRLRRTWRQASAAGA
jgi:hypothetical protein